MKNNCRAAADIDADMKRFEDKPHHTAKWAKNAIDIWNAEKKAAEKGGGDRWPILTEATVKDGAKVKRIGSEIIFELRKHLAALQDSRCCYCRKWLQNVAPARPIEHVLSRKEYPQFSMSYWNMALCCRDCNQLKSKENWSALPRATVHYPTTINDYFHPRIHIYDGHIRYVRLETNGVSYVLYKGITTQGKHLCTNHLHKVAMQEALVNNNPFIAKDIEKLRDAAEEFEGDEGSNLTEFLETLSEAVHRIGKRT